MLRFFTLALASFTGVWLLSAGCNATDWNLTGWHAGPRTQGLYNEPRRAARWQETRRRYHTPRRNSARERASDEPRYDHIQMYRDDEKPKRPMQCLERVTVVGSQWAGEEGAEESAQKAWMEQVRWNDGEAWMDIKNVEGYAKRCARSSVGEVLNQVLHRCEISARPCREVMARAVPK